MLTTFTVDVTGDGGDSDSGDGICDDGAGNCTLRAAIEQANATAGTDTIAFDILGAGPHTIQPLSALPTITDPVIIDGYTQPGSSPNTNGPGLGSNAVLKIELDGSNAGVADGLTITAGSSTVRGLVINRFTRGDQQVLGQGILLQTGGGNILEGNFIGTDVSGNVDLGNALNGVVITSANNTIGGTSPGARNLISGNDLSNGIAIVGVAATGNQVLGNLIGTNAAGTAALGNQGGILLGSANNTIGGATPGARNVISGNTNIGIAIDGRGTNATDNQVLGNFIGVDITGGEPMGNGSFGVSLLQAPNNTIGGPNPGEGNVISDHQLDAIRWNASDDIVVQGNLLGTDVTGTLDLGNGRGIVITVGSANSQIGGTAAGAGNLISGNDLVFGGIAFSSAGPGHVIQGNKIGTDVTGTQDLGNTGIGIFIDSGNNTIGGTAPGAGNLISGNDQQGIVIQGAGATANVVQGNFIGTDVTGTADLGNTSSGVYILFGASNNTIGGTTPGARNVISGNDLHGVLIDAFGTTATGNLVQGNLIGTDVTGTADLGNSVSGVVIKNALNNTIGGTGSGAGNTIAFNGDDGVFVQSGTGNAILTNSIFSNAGLGIDLDGDGVTANDVGDGDTGSNNLQNFPVVTELFAGSTTRVVGSLNSLPNTTFTMEFFANTVADPSGFGEGQRPLGSFSVTTNAVGDAAFDEVLPGGSTVGEFVTATATDPAGNTSEFSGAETVVFLGVEIDIKPDDVPNSINLGSNGTIPVAIFSTPTFDATTIDPTTVTLAEAQVRLRGQGTPMASVEDVNGDGLLDLVVHVETEALQLTETDTQAELLGTTFEGVSFQGFDTIRVVAELNVAGGPAEGVFVGNGLTHATLNSVVEQSLAHWASAGVDPHRLDALRQVDVQIADLSDSLLGVAALDIVWIDRDAAGYGWSVNSGGVDLFAAVTHEFGHVLGLGHTQADDLMRRTLAVGKPYQPARSLISGSFAGDVYSSASDLAVSIWSRDQVFGRLGQSRSSGILGAPSGGWLHSTPATVPLSRDRFFGVLAAEPDHAGRLDDDWTAADDQEEADLFDRLFDRSQRRRRDRDADSENLDERLLDEDVLDELALLA